MAGLSSLLCADYVHLSALPAIHVLCSGKEQEIEASGLLATCLQHEIDHTNGVLFIDHISKLKRDRVMKKFEKAAKRAE